MLANKLQLPVIILKNMGDNTGAAIDYVSTLACDCIVFMDEFEKNFSDENQEIIQMMDGVYNSKYRKIFLLTTNELKVNENLLGRPSRIRYIKEFGNLSKEAAEEYIDENLQDNSAKQTIMEFIDTLTISTIDILKSIVSEVNIHGINEFTEYRKFFNVTTESYNYNFYRGRVWDSDIYKDEEKYTIKNFVSQLNNHLNPLPPVTFKDPKNPTDEEKKAMEIYSNYNKNDFNGFSWRQCNSDKKFTSLKSGDSFNDETVVQVDIESRVIITYDDFDNVYHFNFINNPEAKPSLYNKTYKF